MSGAILRLLVVVSVLICSMHFAEPAAAHAAGEENSVRLIVGHGDQDTPEPDSNLVHGSHHHCPVAPDMRQTTGDKTPMLVREQHFAAIPSRLTSRAPPPLLDPPLA